MIKTQCAICLSKEKLRVLYSSTVVLQKVSQGTFSARRVPDRMHYQFVECLRCGLIFSNPILPPSKIKTFYKRSNFTYTNESEYLKKTYGKYLKEIDTSSKKSLLDIGCGNGFFLEEAEAQGIKKVTGVEPGKDSVKKAKKHLQENIVIDTFHKGIFKKNSFDIVTCFHTLDHIVDPNNFLQTTKDVLKKGGKGLFIVHNTNGLSVKLFKEKSPIFDIEHIYLFNPHTLRKIFQKNKFRVKKVFSVTNIYPISYWLRMSPLPKWFKNFAQSTIKNIKILNIPISIQAGNIGILVEKI